MITKLELQANTMRAYICKMCLDADSGHPSSALSCVDLIAATIVDSHSQKIHDSFILSKGHAAPALYAALIVNGILPRELLTSLREFDSPLQGHPDVTRLREVNATTGALGQGLSMAIGHALAIQIREENRYSYCIIGDGESQEGQIWEAAIFGGNRRLERLIAITDYNGNQSDGPLEEIMPMRNLKQKWEAFGWFVQEVDGHDLSAIRVAIEMAKKKNDFRPSMIIAKTIKGYIKAGYQILNGDHAGKMTMKLYEEVLSQLNMV